MPSINSKNLLKFLKKRGFYIHHQVGSHIVLKHEKEDAKRVTLPMHNKDIKPGTLSSILKQAGIDKKELFK
jgi:predicted RNA binding protein YcfA (HicA-like mRNA interferase family)